MIKRILKKDLKRKKSMNFILLVFVMLATTFIAGSVHDLKVVINGLDYYFEKAGISDFTILAISGSNGVKTENDREIEEFLDGSKYVIDYQVEDSLILDEGIIEEIGDTEIKMSNVIMMSDVETSNQIFFDEENKKISEIPEGEIYLPGKMISENLKVGDSFYIKLKNGKKKFKFAGIVKDALLGSDMMGIFRILISHKDYEELIENGEFASEKTYQINCTDREKFSQAYNQCSFHTIYGADISLFRATYTMDMVIAAILLMVSVCLILISTIMLRFTIIFTINEDYKEIGIMKAIGIPDHSIRFLYVTKYFTISVAGAVLGYFLSIPFGQTMAEEVVKNIVVEDGSSSWFSSLIISISVAGVIAWFAFLSTGKIKKFTPMDAIRSGNNGKRFQRKNILKFSRLPIRPSTFLAANDILCELKKYIILMFVSIIGIWLVVMPVNTINTLQSDEVAAWFGVTPCDFYITETARVEEIILKGNRRDCEEYLEELKEKLMEADIPVDNVAYEVMFNFKISKGKYSSKSMTLQGLGTDIDAYMYEEGSAPKEKNEIAITHIMAKKIHAEIGDTVYIAMYGKEIPFLVTAVYQSMNNMGEGIRFSQNADVDYSAMAGIFPAQLTFKDFLEKEKVEDMREQIQKALPDARVETTKEFIASMIGGITNQIKPLKTLILTVVIIINVLVVVLMQKIFLIREQGEMATLKAIGFSNASIIRWQTKRIAMVLLVGLLLGVFTGTAFSQLTSGQVFKYMGCSRIQFQINIWEVYVLYPVVIYIVTVIACILTMQKARKISVAQMEDE